MNNLRENETIIGRLGIKSENRDVLAMKLRFERLFGAGNFLPENIPPQAIVCIKKLRDPAPQTLNLQANALRFSGVWEKAVAREIEKLYRRAARPVSESVPAQAEAVIFNDRAELLACLASDWCDGILFQNWWWQSLFPNLERAQTIAKIWLESAGFIPAAVKILARKRSVAEFVNKLQPNESADLTEKLILTFGLNKIHKAVFSPITKREKENFQNDLFRNKAVSLSEKTSQKSFGFKTFFESAAEIINGDFVFEKKIFFAVAVMLDRSPRFVRTDEFAEEIRQVKIETELRRKEIISISEKTLSEQKVSEKRPEKNAGILKPSKEKKSQIIFSKETEKGKKSEDAANKKSEINPEKETLIARKSENFQETKQEIKPEKQTKKDEQKIEFEERKKSEKTEITVRKKESKTRETESKKTIDFFPSEILEESENETFEIIIRTGYGGVFFLLNFALYLKLYRDFSEPLGEEIDLNIWDFVALLSLGFVGEKIKKDAVWSLLKKLAGRDSDEEFSFDFSNFDEWRIPVNWLETFSKNEKWSWSETGKRLIVRHSENFNVLDLKRENEKQLERELKEFEEFFSEIQKTKIQSFYENFSPAESWFKNFLEFAERRLLQALDLETGHELNEVLFKRSATIAVSETKLEATFSLVDLPLSVRFSGLDRNSGWIPAAGKYVEFSFV